MPYQVSYQVEARNFSEASENRIHSDDAAQRLGFRGALVPGVAVYGHLTWPLTERYGEHWLSHSQVSVRFMKPAYHGDRLTIELEEQDDVAIATCTNEQGERLAELKLDRSQAPFTDTRELMSALPVDPERVPLNWDAITLNRPFDPWLWEITPTINETFASQVADEHALYAELAHPHGLLSTANTALVRQFEMPAWIHVGSEISHLQPVHVNDQLTVQAAPIERWERKGHEFVKLMVQYNRGDDIVTQIHHTAIFKIAGA